MRKHGGTPSRRDKHVTSAAISPPGVARGRFVGGQQSGLAGCKPPPLFTRGASSCSSQGRRQGNQGAPLHDRVHLPTYLCLYIRVFGTMKGLRQFSMISTLIRDCGELDQLHCKLLAFSSVNTSVRCHTVCDAASSTDTNSTATPPELVTLYRCFPLTSCIPVPRGPSTTTTGTIPTTNAALRLPLLPC